MTASGRMPMLFVGGMQGVKMKKRSLVIRIVAIVLCVLMVLGIVAGAISAFAAEAAPATGSTSQAVPIAVGVIAVLLITICIVMPMFKKKTPVEPTKNDNPQNIVDNVSKDEPENEIKG